MAATLEQMVTLLELLLPQVAGHHRSAVSIHAISEVLTSQADPGSFPVLKLPLIDKIPLLDNPPQQTGYSTRIRLKRLPPYARCVR